VRGCRETTVYQEHKCIRCSFTARVGNIVGEKEFVTFKLALFFSFSVVDYNKVSLTGSSFLLRHIVPDELRSICLIIEDLIEFVSAVLIL
jgi:hypothetical protein